MDCRIRKFIGGSMATTAYLGMTYVIDINSFAIPNFGTCYEYRQTLVVGTWYFLLLM